MRRIELDGTCIADKMAFHDELARQMELPDWYGRNLDALHDCLSAVQETEIVLRHWPEEGDLARVRRVMVDAAWENDGLLLTIIE